jgi:histidine triad (HIT) family protein
MTTDFQTGVEQAESCVFCKIAAGGVPAVIEFEDERCVAFRDIHPAAPTHILIAPRRHVEKLSDCEDGDEALLGHLQLVAIRLAARLGLTGGCRLIINNGAGAGQSVWHLHIHLLAGRPMKWPPG